MQQVNLRGIDLNLLVVLDALLADANVTRAGERLGMSQPAVSRALQRLRTLTGDPLLVRAATGFQPTARARVMQPALAALLGGVKSLVVGDAFDPATHRGEWRIVATDHQTIMALPPIMARLSRDAPNADVHVIAAGAGSFERLANGEIDLAFGVAETRVPNHLKRQALYRDRFVSVLRQGHPALRDWSLDRFLALNHVLVTILDDGKGAIDALLEAQGRSRRIALRLPHFFAALSIVSTSDLVVTVPFTIANRFAAEYRLSIVETPIHRPPFEVISLWSEVVDLDPASRFLRAVVREETRGIAGIMPV